MTLETNLIPSSFVTLFGRAVRVDIHFPNKLIRLERTVVTYLPPHSTIITTTIQVKSKVIFNVRKWIKTWCHQVETNIRFVALREEREIQAMTWRTLVVLQKTACITYEKQERLFFDGKTMEIKYFPWWTFSDETLKTKPKSYLLPKGWGKDRIGPLQTDGPLTQIEIWDALFCIQSKTTSSRFSPQ